MKPPSARGRMPPRSRALPLTLPYCAAPPMSTQQRAPTVAYDSDDFERATERIPEALRSGEGMIFLLVGASQEEKQEVLTKLSAPGELNLHRFKVPNLVGDRLVETQGNLREAFDHADEDAAVLFFDEADVLLDGSGDRNEPAPETKKEKKKAERAEQEDAALSDYFFDRVENYPGVAAVCFSEEGYVDRLEGHGADVIVKF